MMDGQLNTRDPSKEQLRKAYAQAVELCSLHVMGKEIRSHVVRLQEILAIMLRDRDDVGGEKRSIRLTAAGKKEILERLPKMLAEWHEAKSTTRNFAGLAVGTVVFTLSYGLTDVYSYPLGPTAQWNFAAGILPLIAIAIVAGVYAAHATNMVETRHLKERPDISACFEELSSPSQLEVSSAFVEVGQKADKKTESKTASPKAAFEELSSPSQLEVSSAFVEIGQKADKKTESKTASPKAAKVKEIPVQPETESTKTLRSLAVLSGISKRLFGGTSAGISGDKWMSGSLAVQSGAQVLPSTNARLSAEVDRYESLDMYTDFTQIIFGGATAAAMGIGAIYGLSRVFDPAKPFGAHVNLSFIIAGAVFVGIAVVAKLIQMSMRNWEKYSSYRKDHISAVLHSPPGFPLSLEVNEPEIAHQISTFSTTTKNQLALLQQRGIYFTTKREYGDDGDGTNTTFRWPVLVQFDKSERKEADLESKGGEKPKSTLTNDQFQQVVHAAYGIITSDTPLVELSEPSKKERPRPSGTKMLPKNKVPPKDTFRFDRHDYDYFNLKTDYGSHVEEVGSIRKAKALGAVLSALAPYGLLTTSNLKTIKDNEQYLLQYAAVLRGVDRYFKYIDKQYDASKFLQQLIDNPQKLEAIDPVVCLLSHKYFLWGKTDKKLFDDKPPINWLNILPKLVKGNDEQLEGLYDSIEELITLDETATRDKSPVNSATRESHHVVLKKLLESLKPWTDPPQQAVLGAPVRFDSSSAAAGGQPATGSEQIEEQDFHTRLHHSSSVESI